jgi:hypothetical protein
VRSVLQYFARKNGLKRTINRGLLDAMLQQAMIIKIGYSTRHVGNTSPAAPGQASGISRLEDKPFFGKFFGRKSRDTSGVENYEQSRIIKQGPVHFRVSPRHLLTHPDAELPADLGCRWLAHMVIRPLEAVRRDERYGMRWRKKIRPSAVLDPRKVGQDQMQKCADGQDATMQFVILYEVWDRMTREVFVLAHDQPDIGPARSLKWPFKGMEGFPFVIVTPIEVPEEFWGLTELDPVETQMQELDRVRTLQLRHLLRYQRKYAVATENVEADTLDKLRHGEDGAIVEFDQEIARGAIEPIEDVALPGDTYAFEGNIKTDINNVMGITENLRGASTSKTATEASFINTAADARTEFSVDQLNEGLAEYYRKTLQICQQWLPKDLVLRIAGRLGEEWRKITPEDIAGEYDISIVAGSTSVPNRELLRAQMVNVFGALRGDPEIDQIELKRLFLKQFPELISQATLQKLLKVPGVSPGEVPPETLSEPAAAPEGAVPPEGAGMPGAGDPEALLQAALASQGGLG